MWRDFRFGLRLLLASPGFTAVAVLTLALGIAANTVVFSWIDELLLRPFGSAAQAGRLAVLEGVTAEAPEGTPHSSYLDYRDFRANLKSVSGLAVHREDVFNLGEAPAAQPVWGELVSGNYFAVLGVKPVLGRTFTAEEDGDKLGAYPVAVISERLWRRLFHGDRTAVGKSLRVNRRDLTVVGVAPSEFNGTVAGLRFDIWVPMTMAPALGMFDEEAFRTRDRRLWYVVARLGPGSSMEQARAEAATYARDLERANPKSNRGVGATVLPVWQNHSGATSQLLGPLRILMAAAIVVLLIVSANVANLLLARSLARRKELAIRAALGASGARLSRQLLTEVLMLAVAGTLLGLLGAAWMADMLPALVPKVSAPVAMGFHLSGRIFAFTALACLVTTLASGAAPALLWRQADVHEALKEGGRSGTHGIGTHRVSGLLVTAEVALATVALIAGGVFYESFRRARALDAGFDRTNVVLARFYVPAMGLSTEELLQFDLRLAERLRQDPAIVGVSYADEAPLGTGGGPKVDFSVEGYVPAPKEPMEVGRYLVAPGFFSVLRIPVLEGRDFDDNDDSLRAPVVVVNRSFSERYFHGASPIGRRMVFHGQPARVIGMVKDSRYFDIEEAPQPHLFAPFRPIGSRNQMFFFIKTAGNPAAVMAGLRHQVAAVDRNAGAFDVMLLREYTEITLLPQRVGAGLMAAVGLMSLVLAAIGLYTLMAYAVTERTREIGIRMALGAQRREVLADVVGRGVALTLPGLGAGIAAAVGLARLAGSRLVGVSVNDPRVYASAVLFLAGVAFLATWLPALRATKVDPMVALRSE